MTVDRQAISSGYVVFARPDERDYSGVGPFVGVVDDVLTVDGRELNRMNLADLRNPDGQSPFLQPAYMLLNLAIGGQAAGDPSAVPFPVRYEVDYVRVYERQ